MELLPFLSPVAAALREERTKLKQARNEVSPFLFTRSKGECYVEFQRKREKQVNPLLKLPAPDSG